MAFANWLSSEQRALPAQSTHLPSVWCFLGVICLSLFILFSVFPFSSFVFASILQRGSAPYGHGRRACDVTSYDTTTRNTIQSAMRHILVSRIALVPDRPARLMTYCDVVIVGILISITDVLRTVGYSFACFVPYLVFGRV